MTIFYGVKTFNFFFLVAVGHNTGEEKNNIGPIIGGVIGVLVVIVIIAAIIIYISRFVK